ncbi:uncharacterized protein LOC131311576 [Rhododendron vialii]|uniref:uncharacterized protein LOC131311576 n=1 Tax=Rhododendron vialii TaxID=182163 RepID=UPI00265EAA3E|nr:uncharacterized protein LOC131311576 [Rhododendron vialii]
MASESREFPSIDEESSRETSEMLYATRRCCFCIPYRSSAVGINWWRMRPAEFDSGGWWARGIAALMKLREWSEIAAGPRWKTFIRRFNRSRSGLGNKQHAMKFQYDPLSYSLNFDDGAGQKGNGFEDEVEYGFRNFSSRYASVPVSAKSSMDLGKEAVVFT